MSKFEIKPLKFSDWSENWIGDSCRYAFIFYGRWEITICGLSVYLTFWKKDTLTYSKCVAFKVGDGRLDKAITYANRIHRIMMRQYLTEVE
jgi:hypothetical protein